MYCVIPRECLSNNLSNDETSDSTGQSKQQVRHVTVAVKTKSGLTNYRMISNSDVFDLVDYR